MAVSTCPNKNYKTNPNQVYSDWQLLINKIGVREAYREYIKNNETIPNADNYKDTFKGVNATLKVVGALENPKTQSLFDRFYKNNPDKFYQELVPLAGKEQVNLLKEWNEINSPESLGDMITGVLSEMSYTVEINISQKRIPDNSDARGGTTEMFTSGFSRYWKGGSKYFKEGLFTGGVKEISKEEFEKAVRKYPIENSNYYSNLTVPGGTNYTENEIATPEIIPAIKGHAQFATNNGIGWFRSDEQISTIKEEKSFNPNYAPNGIDFESMTQEEMDDYVNRRLHESENKPYITTYNGSKTRRILEVQSDLFQKGRDKENIVAPDSRINSDFIKENKFLQILNKDNNWVTFFVKSIIQDSIRKGYEKIVFPKGNTASKIEGHETVEQFIKDKEDRIKKLRSEYGEGYNEDGESLEDRQREIKQIELEIENVRREGFGALKPIFKFYEEVVGNILKKQGYNPKEVTDEYNNVWYEIDLTNVSSDTIYFQKNEESTKNPNKELNDKLLTFLSSKGISVEAVEQIKTVTGDDAIASTDFINKVIKVVNNKANESTLPEETGHVFMKMLGKNNPLYQRMMYLASKSSKLIEVKAQYEGEYETEEEYVFETAGKLLSDALIDRFTNEKQSLIEQIKGVLKLVLAKIKTMFKLSDIDTLETLIKDTYGVSATNILNNTLEESEYLNRELNSKSGSIAYQKDNPLDDFKVILNKSLNRLKQKLSKYRRQHVTDLYHDELNDIYNQLLDNPNIEGFTKFVEQATKDIDLAHKRYKKMVQLDKPMDLRELRNIRNQVLAYDVLDEFIATPFTDNRFRVLKASLTNSIVNEDGSVTESTITQKEEIKRIFLNYATKHISNFLYEYGKINPNMTPSTIEEQLQFVSTDINAAVSWLDSIGDSRDTILALSAKVIRDRKENVRLKAVDIKVKLIKLLEDYEKKSGKKGLDIFEGMWEKDENGNLTGNLISNLDSKFFRDMNIEEKRLEEIFKNNPDKVARELSKWTKKNRKDKKYKEQYQKLEEDKDKFALFLELKGIFQEAQDLLPTTFKMFNKGPQVRKRTLERIVSNDIKNARKTIKNELLDRFTIQEDDTEYGILDESGKPYNTIPIYYTNLLEDKETGKYKSSELNTDLVSGIYKFYNMALNYSEMSTIQDEIETIKELLAEREVAKTRFGKPQISPITGETIVEKGIESNSYKMFEQYLASQLYGQTKAEGKTVNILGYNIDLGKVADFFNKYTAVNGLAGNLFSGVSNITVGRINRLTEAVAGQYFNAKDRYVADGIYFYNLPSLIVKDTGKRNQNSKLGLWNEKLDVLQNHSEDVMNLTAFQKNRFSRLFKLNTLFFFNTAGEHWMQTTTSLAAAQNWELSTGKVVNMWEEAEVVNGKLIFKNPAITLEEVKRFIDITKGINQSLDGIYNDVDKSNAQRYAIGRMALLFRKFIVPGVQKRFKGAMDIDPLFNYRTQQLEEGFYVTAWRQIPKLGLQLLKDLKSLEFNTIAHWNELDTYQKANIKRALTEITFMMGLAVLSNALEDWEDDEEFYQFAIYEVNRTYTELRFFSSPNEALKILKSPAAAVTSIQSVTGLVGALMQPWDWADRYERGRRAGDLKIGAKFTDAIPLVNKVDDWSDLGRQIDYIK